MSFSDIRYNDAGVRQHMGRKYTGAGEPYRHKLSHTHTETTEFKNSIEGVYRVPRAYYDLSYNERSNGKHLKHLDSRS